MLILCACAPHPFKRSFADWLSRLASAPASSAWSAQMLCLKRAADLYLRRHLAAHPYFPSFMIIFKFDFADFSPSKINITSTKSSSNSFNRINNLKIHTSGNHFCKQR